MIQTIYKKPAIIARPSTYCPGCTHGIINQVVASVIEEMGLEDDAIMVCGVGCSTPMNAFWDIDALACEHGRAPAAATGVKRFNKDKLVFTNQGDGDLAGIGTTEIVHAAHRGEKFTTIYINNSVYGMTGGQMAPTTLVDQVTTTTPYGRDESSYGKPIKIGEMLATLDGAKFVARCAVDCPANIRKAKKIVKRAFECQLKGIGFSIVEFVAACPTNLGMNPVEAQNWIREKMIPYYPLGIIKDYEG